MTTAGERSFGEILNTWVQTIGIIGAGCWGAYVFMQEKVWAPASAPVNISINVQLKKIGPKNDQPNLTAVEFQTAANNPSIRDVYLLQSAWIATGCNIGAGPDQASFADLAEKSLNDRPDNYVDQFSAPTACSVVAAGHVYRDQVLRPNETIRRTIIFYVPSDQYDELKVEVRMPTAEKYREVFMKWKIENADLKDNLVGEDGKTPLEHDPHTGGYLDKDLKKFGVQQARSQATLSLWR